MVYQRTFLNPPVVFEELKKDPETLQHLNKILDEQGLYAQGDEDDDYDDDDLILCPAGELPNEMVTMQCYKQGLPCEMFALLW